MEDLASGGKKWICKAVLPGRQSKQLVLGLDVWTSEMSCVFEQQGLGAQLSP